VVERERERERDTQEIALYDFSQLWRLAIDVQHVFAMLQYQKLNSIRIGFNLCATIRETMKEINSIKPVNIPIIILKEN